MGSIGVPQVDHMGAVLLLLLLPVVQQQQEVVVPVAHNQQGAALVACDPGILQGPSTTVEYDGSSED